MKKLTKRTKLVFGLLHLSIPLLLTGCSSDNKNESTVTDSGNQDETSVSNEDDGKNNTISNSNETVEENKDTDKPKLAGTCPYGNHCSAPGKCGLFTDDNTNNLCDRGE